MDIPANMMQRLDPLVTYLGQQLHRPERLRLSPDLANAVHTLADGSTDIAYLTPVAFLLAEQQAGARALVTPIANGHQGAADPEPPRQEDTHGKPTAIGISYSCFANIRSWGPRKTGHSRLYASRIRTNSHPSLRRRAITKGKTAIVYGYRGTFDTVALSFILLIIQSERL